MIKGKTMLVAAMGAAAVGLAVERSGAQDRTAVPGAYTLAQVDGRALPLVVETDGACRDELLSATLTLAEGVWTLDTVERELCEGQAAKEDRESERGRYTLAGAAVTFTPDDTDRPDADDAPGAVDIDVDELATGTVEGGALTVRLHGGQTLAFRR
ncbi:hypothetical protein [Longimicrobium sp.]|uniref:hypothetical protein n=1 Tax=Longimicrobium sp. TaxID=2029185 RepID=UPI003B3A247E